MESAQIDGGLDVDVPEGGERPGLVFGLERWKRSGGGRRWMSAGVCERGEEY